MKMHPRPNDSRPDDPQMALCEKALQLAGQLPSLLRQGNSSNEILDQLAPLLRQLTGGSASAPRTELSPRVRALLTQVLERMEEAQVQAKGWINAAAPRLARMANAQKMQRAYGSRRF